MNNAQEMMREALNKKPKPALDAVEGDSGLSGADVYTKNDITLKAVASVQQWVEADDLDDGESCADRLLALVVGIADANKDGEISEDEQGVVDIALNAIWDYLAKYGAEDGDISSLLNDWDNDAAERIRDLLASALPEGEDADADLDNFVFSDQEATFDAVYKMTKAVRAGKLVRIKKRISGTVRLSAKQKISIRKAGLKSHSAAAMMHRARSNKVRKQKGLK
jgi:hypothetical protein